MDEKLRSKAGSQAANIGTANEHIALGILMQKYNASKVDLPSSKFDIILLHNKKYIRIQSKTAHPSIGLKGNVRAGKANKGASDVNTEIKFQMNKLGYNNDQFYILYGGSVNMSNLSCIINISSLDGFLIGGASLNPDDFWDLIKTNKG